MAIEPNRVYSREEATDVLGVSLSTLKRMINSGALRVSQPDEMRRIFITGQALLETEQVENPAIAADRPAIQPNAIYSRQEAADILNISLSTMKRLINSDQIVISQPPGMRRVFITGQSLLDFLESHIMEPSEDFDDDE
jgi:predicted site-specific integrase-resolvase